MRRHAGAVLGGLDRVFGRGTVAAMGEEELLDRFVAGGDEEAFAAIVARHGPMVLGVCRRVLRDEHDVDDAFQATFLVLVRRAAGLRDGDGLGGWLHGVARRVAARARAQAARRHARERDGLEVDRLGVWTPPEEPSADLRAVLDDELARLPGPLRTPLVLCYLDGLTHEEAAERLGWPVGTVRSRMARGRDRLRGRLARRGLVATGAALAAATAHSPVSGALLAATVRACLIFATRRATSIASASAGAAALAQGALNAMTLSKLKVFATASLAVLFTAGGVPTLARQLGGAGAARKSAEAPARPVDRKDAPDRSLAAVQEELEVTDRLAKEISIGAVRDELEVTNRRTQEMRHQLQSTEARVASLQGELKSLRRRAALKGDAAKDPVDTAKEAPKQDDVGALRAALAEVNRRNAQLEHDLLALKRQLAGQREGSKPETSARFPFVPATTNAAAASAGDPPDPDAPRIYKTSRFVVVASPDGHKVAAYDPRTGKTNKIHLAEAGSPRLKVTLSVAVGGPYQATSRAGGSQVVLGIAGPGISRLAVLSAEGDWYVENLREPTDEAKPLEGSGGVVAYLIGRHVYAFSGAAKRWDVLVLSGRGKSTMDNSNGTITVDHDGHLYTFGQQAGKWTDVDFRKILDDPAEQAPPPGN